MIGTNATYFNAGSPLNDMRCFVFEPVQDDLVEDDELMSFQASASNPLDTFTNGQDGFGLTIVDDDGKCDCCS